VRVRLLGPVDVMAGGIARPVSGLRRKAVLAALGLYPGEAVSVGRLVDAVWGERPPATAAQTLPNHVSYLRGVLGVNGAIVARRPGYVLDVPAEATDVAVAERLIRRSRQAVDRAESAASLRAALALWRGTSLADVGGSGWLAEHAERLEQVRLEAVEALVQVRLELGEHAQVVTQLQQLTTQHPLRESIHRQLILALYRGGRQADALAAYRRLRTTLREELGVDPGLELQRLEAAMLRHDPALDPPPSTIIAAAGSAVCTVPAQLPSAVAAFTGRTAELTRLDLLLAAAHRAGTDRGSTVIISVSGTAGVGKTALAVQWAHRVAASFPDGQLYVNLRGYDPGGLALDPAEAVRGFLDALGMPAHRIPAGLDARAALYRSLLAGKRVLVVLDNARDVEQVRPLVPGTSGCLVVVTSRNQLTPLAATEGAHPLRLDLLSTAEAIELLSRRLGARRTAAEPAAVHEIVVRCAGLPLALAIAAARAATNPGFPLVHLAAELRGATGALDAFDGGDPATDVRTVFSWSQQTLSADAARLFRLLGLHPGPDLTAPAAASVAGIPLRQVRILLTELTRAHLLNEHTPGRYTFHDLLRTYADEQARTHDSDDVRRAALHRLLDHYLHTAFAAAVLLLPARDPITLDPPKPGLTPEPHVDHDTALEWFTAEYRVLVAAIERAAAVGFDAHAWKLAWAFTTFLLRRGLWPEQLVVQRTALGAARRLGDKVGQGHALQSLAIGYGRADRLDDADTHYRLALDLYADLGDLVGQATSYANLGVVARKRGHPVDALSHAQRALELYSAAGHRVGQANALNSVGYGHAQIGDYRQAILYCRHAVTLLHDLGHGDSEAATWESLGYAHHRLGETEQAARCYQQAVDLFRRLGDRSNEAGTLASLGDTHHAAGDHAAARTAWKQALNILDEFADPDAERIRAKLLT
jgi:DNA-binding SARP family transcriptional activator/tetratricopeptide (TPR) repeat protein